MPKNLLSSSDAVKSKLTDRELKFAIAYVETGAKAASAKIAGYRHPGVAANRLLDREHVLDFIIDTIRKRHKSEIVAAHHCLVSLLESDSDNVKLKAADMIMSRSGFLIAQEKTVNYVVKDERTDQELISSIVSMLSDIQLKDVTGTVIENNQQTIEQQPAEVNQS